MQDLSLGQPISLAGLLFMTVVISMSGVLVPGPVFAATVAKGRQNRYAGAFIALGHGFVELPLMALIYLGLVQFVAGDAFRRGVSLLGGAALLYLGYALYRAETEPFSGDGDASYGSLAAGVITTGANPYFYIWWATAGAALIMSSSYFGAAGFLLFALVHLSCDFFWNLGVSWTVFKSKKFWSPRTHGLISKGCGLLLVGFGGWFIYYSVA